MSAPKLFSTSVSSLKTAASEDAPDALVVVAPVDPAAPTVGWDAIDSAIRSHLSVDKGAAEGAAVIAVAGAPGGRLILSPTGSLDGDFDDVRQFGRAARAGVERARGAGATKVALVFAGIPSEESFLYAREVGTLEAIGGMWQPLEAREALGENTVESVAELHVADLGDPPTVTKLAALEAGRRLARDIGGTNPERMAPARVAQACEESFAGGPVKVEVTRDLDALRKDYPLLMAVARASTTVERHRPCVVRLTYDPGPSATRSVFIAGKGVTYDTGGADLKTDGHMVGMSRDKGGAAAAAGFMKTVEMLAPKHIKVVVELGLVRNSIGADSFVADEIVVAHSGKRVRIGDTDAEGRLVLADVLSHLRPLAVEAKEPWLLSIATLTGHAALAHGPYATAVENGPGQRAQIAHKLAVAGQAWGDPFSPSELRGEDFHFIRPRTKADDVLSCNNAPSSRTPRGHQFPAAFLVVAAGLAEHGKRSAAPLPFAHIDIAGSGVEGMNWQHGRPTGSPVLALAGALLDPK